MYLGGIHDLRQQDQLLQLQQGPGPATADDCRRCAGRDHNLLMYRTVGTVIILSHVTVTVGTSSSLFYISCVRKICLTFSNRPRFSSRYNFGSGSKRQLLIQIPYQFFGSGYVFYVFRFFTVRIRDPGKENMKIMKKLHK